MSEIAPPRVYFTNWMNMSESEEDARHDWPRSEWEDLRAYVLKSDHDAIQAELDEFKSKLKRAEALLKRFESMDTFDEIKKYFAENK